MTPTKNDEHAAKISQQGPEHDVNECDAAEHGRYEDNAATQAERNAADTRKPGPKPY